MDISEDLLEKIIIKFAMNDKRFVYQLVSQFEPRYFNNSKLELIYTSIREHFKQYKNIPSKSIIIDSIDNNNEDIDSEDIKEKINEIEAEIDLDVSSNYDYIIDNTNKLLKERALKEALFKSADLVQNKGNIEKSRELIEKALCKNLNIDLGLDYWRQLGERLKRKFTEDDLRIPTYYPLLDEFISGGFPEKTLSIFLAKIHGHKSNLLSNMASRQALNGYNPIIFSFEMAQDQIAQRLDSIHTSQDINKMYIEKSRKVDLWKKLKEMRENVHGKLILKEFPTGAASLDDMRNVIRELDYRGVKVGPIICDYVNLVKPNDKRVKRHEQIKEIAHGLRAMSYEFLTPVISVSQLNREGMFADFKNDVDFTFQSEGIEVSAIADFNCILGKDEDDMVYESEIFYKITKNRFGGRVGEFGSLYFDDRSLKLYDKSELDQWISDCTNLSGGNIRMVRNE